jgi:hypothetical protein
MSHAGPNLLYLWLCPSPLHGTTHLYYEFAVAKYTGNYKLFNMSTLALCAGCWWVKSVLYDSTLNRTPNLANITGIKFVTFAEPYLVCTGGPNLHADIGRVEIPIAGNESAPSQFKITTYPFTNEVGGNFTLNINEANEVMRWMHHDTKAAPEYQYQYIDTGFRNAVSEESLAVCFKIELLDTKDQPKNLTFAFSDDGSNVVPTDWSAASAPWSLSVDEATGVVDFMAMLSHTATVGTIAIRVSGRTIGQPAP